MTMSTPFAPRMSNIPLWNLREEFHTSRKVIEDPAFEEALKSRSPRQPISTPLFDWRGNGSDLLSLLVQRAVQGAESYTSGVGWVTLGRMGKLTKETNKQVRNPFSIQGRDGAAAAYYHHLPSLIHTDLSIKVLDPEGVLPRCSQPFVPRVAIRDSKRVKRARVVPHHQRNLCLD